MTYSGKAAHISDTGTLVRNLRHVRRRTGISLREALHGRLLVAVCSCGHGRTLLAVDLTSARTEEAAAQQSVCSDENAVQLARAARTADVDVDLVPVTGLVAHEVEHLHGTAAVSAARPRRRSARAAAVANIGRRWHIRADVT